MARNNEAIRELLDDFAERLTAVVHKQALENVREALIRESGSLTPQRPPRKKAGARRKKTGRRRRRSTGSSITSDQLLAGIRQHEGERTEVIAREMGVAAKDFKPQLDELVNTGVVIRKGKARGTTLHLG